MARSAAFFVVALFLVAPFVVAQADDPQPPAAAPVDLQNRTCPVSGMPVAPGISKTVDGAVVHFCSKEHAERYAKDPAAYDQALRKDPAVARRMETIHTGATPQRPVAGETASKAADLHAAMRKLWAEHVVWTRTFVISALADLPDKDAATKRLLRNQEDIGNAIKPFYGDEAGTKLTALLKDHITTAADLVGALKANETEKAEAAKQRWSSNADEIAAFLAKANAANWPLESAKTMLHEHLDLTTQAVKARLDKDWEADVAAFDKVSDQALRMADMLADGIERQFPAKFQ